jgi:hypothetical protein
VVERRHDRAAEFIENSIFCDDLEQAALDAVSHVATVRRQAAELKEIFPAKADQIDREMTDTVMKIDAELHEKLEFTC